MLPVYELRGDRGDVYLAPAERLALEVSLQVANRGCLVQLAAGPQIREHRLGGPCVAAELPVGVHLQVAARQNVAQLGVVVDGRVYEGRFREYRAGQLIENALDLLLGRTCRYLHRLTRNRDAGVHDGVLDESFGLLAVRNGLFLLALDDVLLRLGVVAAGLGLGVLLDFGGVVEDVVVVAFCVEH